MQKTTKETGVSTGAGQHDVQEPLRRGADPTSVRYPSRPERTASFPLEEENLASRTDLADGASRACATPSAAAGVMAEDTGEALKRPHAAV